VNDHGAADVASGRLVRVLVITGGHSFDAPSFFAVFDDMPSIAWTHAAHPEALSYFAAPAAAEFDVFVFYDMPGLTFTKSDPPVIFSDPPASFVADFEALLAAGKGMVFLHHAIASWPTWPRFAEIVGGRFHYLGGSLGSVTYPDSGYVLDVRHTVNVLDPSHPICAGLPSSFALTDELYMFPAMPDSVHPVMATTFPVDDPSKFSSAELAIRGQRGSNEGWTHPAGCPLVAWTKHVGNSPLAYLQFGDGPITYADPTYRQILANTITWAAQP
jgi:uncharacterized protein